MDFKQGGRTRTAGLAKDNSFTCYNCGQVGQVSRNCPNCNFMKKLLNQALVSKDATIAKSGCQCKDRKRAGAPTGWKENAQLVIGEEAKQKTNSEAESELETLSSSDSEAGNGKGG